MKWFGAGINHERGTFINVSTPIFLLVSLNSDLQIYWPGRHGMAMR
jgi:hypothetical protein